MSNRYEDWEPTAWRNIGEVIKPADVLVVRSMVVLPEFAESDICTVCAIACDVQWPLAKEAVFTDRQCVGCGRTAPTTKVKNWTWKS